MEEAEILRFTQNSFDAQVGVFLIYGVPFFLTLEPSLVAEHPCIPEGSYVCKKVYNRTTLGGTFLPQTFEITNVPKRSGILFHVGNTGKDTRGCVLLGSVLIKYNFIGNSRDAFENFLKIHNEQEEFKLKVRSA